MGQMGLSAGLALLAVQLALLVATDAAVVHDAVKRRSGRQLSQAVLRSAPNRDVFGAMKEGDRVEWQKNGNVPIQDWIRVFSHLPTTMNVDVVLVGFMGETVSRVHLSDLELERHLHALRGDLPSVVLQPEPTALTVRPHVKFRTMHAKDKLVVEATTALQWAADEQKARPGYIPGTPLTIPHWSIDAVIAADWEKRYAADHPRAPPPARRAKSKASEDGSDGSDQDVGASDPLQSGTAPVFTIYVMALGLNPIESHAYMDIHAEYAYGFEDKKPGLLEHTRPVIHNTGGNCPGTFWVAPGNQTYMWIDIAAGPVSYGPGTMEDGQVFPHSLPQPRLYKPHALHRALVPDVAALLWSAALHHLWPPLVHADLKPEVFTELEVVVVHMHDSLERPASRFDLHSGQEALAAAAGSSQMVTVKEAWVSFARCDMCVAVYSEALRVQSAREINSQLVRARSTKVLDRRALHTALKAYGDVILTYAAFRPAGEHSSDPLNHPTKRLLPVFVFDISGSHHTADVMASAKATLRDESIEPQAVLIDGKVKAAALGHDMVVAVASRKAQAHTTFSCAHDRMSPDASDVTREVLAELLTAGWGVPDISTFYTAASGQSVNHLWSIGNTPYGPMSLRRSLASPTVQAVRRGLALAALNSSTTRILDVLHGVQRILPPSGRLEPGLLGPQRSLLLERLNVAMWKAREAARLLGAWETEAGVKFAKSLVHEARGLERAATKIGQRLEGRVECQGVTSLWSFWWAPAGSLALWPLALFVRKRVYAPKMEKIY